MSASAPGRRLMPWEVAKAAAAMGLPVSGRRYGAETEEDRNRRAAAYEAAADTSAAIRPVHRTRLRGFLGPPKRRRPWR
jgi:hypothetical protein